MTYSQCKYLNFKIMFTTFNTYVNNNIIDYNILLPIRLYLYIINGDMQTLVGTCIKNRYPYVLLLIM